MAQRNIDFGTFPNDPDADAIRTAFVKTQENFSELFSGLQDQAVLSIREGAGITVNAPTGNVEITANIAQVSVQSSTLNMGIGSAGSTLPAAATLTTSAQTLIIELPATVNSIANLNVSNTITSNTVNVALTINGNVASFSGALSAASITTGGNANVTGNVNAGNINVGIGNFTGNINSLNANLGNLANANNLTISSTANIGGNLTSANANLGNLSVANYFSGDGSLLTNVVAAPGNIILNSNSNVSIPTANSSVFVSVAGTANVLVISQTGINANGTANFTGNLSAANANLGNAASANYFIGNFYGTANSATTATTAGTVTTAAQPNITSVGTLTSLGVSGNITAANITANTGVFTGNGSGLSAIAGANVTGTVASATAATTAGTVTTAAQPNITSVGTLTSLAVTGNANVGN
jgi:hypothetical protein